MVLASPPWICKPPSQEPHWPRNQGLLQDVLDVTMNPGVVDRLGRGLKSLNSGKAGPHDDYQDLGDFSSSLMSVSASQFS
jgi:hypothetical protein